MSPFTTGDDGDDNSYPNSKVLKAGTLGPDAARTDVVVKYPSAHHRSIFFAEVERPEALD
jgi:hypothetical protein